MLTDPTWIIVLVGLSAVASAHQALFSSAMLGFNVTASTQTPVPGDNRPVIPLMHRTFRDWWFHGLLDFPPHKHDIMQLPVGKTKWTEINCDKGGTSYWRTSAGSTYTQKKGSGENDPCPGYPMSQYHTTGINDLGGCALAVAYKSDFRDVKPEDFVVFSVQHKCVWTRWTSFDVPQAMPPCPNGKCICAWFWIHSPNSGSEQNYMTGFQCNFPGATSKHAVAKGRPARRCGAEPKIGKKAAPWNCTIGAKQPFYWYQKERNNMFEGDYSPPQYTDLYHFTQGSQNKIFVNSDISGGYYKTQSPRYSRHRDIAARVSSNAGRPIDTIEDRDYDEDEDN